MPIGSSRILCPYRDIQFARFVGLADSVEGPGECFKYSCECNVGGVWRQCKLYVNCRMKKVDAEHRSCVESA